MFKMTLYLSIIFYAGQIFVFGFCYLRVNTFHENHVHLPMLTEMLLQ